MSMDVGCCPDCRREPDRVVYAEGGVSGVFENEDPTTASQLVEDFTMLAEAGAFAADWDMWAFCDRCEVRWKLGQMCAPPGPDDEVVSPRGLQRRRWVAPRGVGPRSSLAFFNRGLRDDWWEDW